MKYVKNISQIGIDSKNIYFIYDGIKIDKNLSFQQLINEKDRKRNTINVLVYEEEKINIIVNNEYWNKINYTFKKNPQLRFNLEITDTNSKYGNNDIFEVFISYKDNKEYIASPNKNTDNMDIFSLLDQKKVYSLQGHKTYIKAVRYFLNKETCNDYLISADEYKIVIIWDINNNYIIKYKINTNYGVNDDICSCLLLFEKNNNYIITSTNDSTNSPFLSGTNIYSFLDSKYIKYIKKSDTYPVWYLLSWVNKSNNTTYIIQLSFAKIILNDLWDNEFIIDLKKHADCLFSGFIFTNNNIEYICSSTSNGLIIICNLYDKTIFNVIKVNDSIFYGMTDI